MRRHGGAHELDEFSQFINLQTEETATKNDPATFLLQHVASCPLGVGRSCAEFFLTSFETIYIGIKVNTGTFRKKTSSNGLKV